MVNKGSSVAFGNVVNAVEYVFAIREGQLRMYVQDPDTGDWVPGSSVPLIPEPATTFNVFVKALTAGSVTQMDAHACKRILVISHPDNTGRIRVGGETVSAGGIPLEPGQTQELPLSNTNQVYVIAEASNAQVIIAYVG